MKQFLVLTVLLTLAACARAPTPGDGAQPDLAPLVFGGPGDESASGLAKHGSGVYAAGITTNKPHPGSPGETDAFIRKYSSNRSVIWTRKFGSDAFEFVDEVASDGLDNAYVVGSTYGDLAGSRGAEDAFIRKYTSSGGVAWTRQFGTGSSDNSFGYDFAKGVATYGSAVYVVGGTDGKLEGSVGDGGLFIRKYTTSGSVSWTRQFGFTESEYSSDYIADVAVDGSGNAYVVGATDRTPGTSNGGYDLDLFVRKYSPGGSVVWTQQLDFSIYDFAEAVAVSGGNVYLGVSYVSDDDGPGNYEYGVRIVKFSTGGVRAQGWGFVYEPVGSHYIEDLSTDGVGNIYFSGSTQPTISDDFDGMVVKLSPSGARVWGKLISSSKDDGASTVLARTPSEVYAAGLTTGKLGEANRGNLDPFLRRLRGGDGSTVWTEQ